MSAYTLQAYAYYRARIKGSSDRLIRAAWRQYRSLLAGGIDDPTCDQDVLDWLEQIITDKVNDSTSRFYIRG